MSEVPKPQINYYGLVFGGKPLIALGIESRKSAEQRVNAWMGRQMESAHMFSYIDIRRPPETYTIAIGILGLSVNLFEV